MGLNWRQLELEKPASGQRCLTKMKHGIIEGTFDAEDNDFSAYYWRDMTWYASQWVPIEEVE